MKQVRRAITRCPIFITDTNYNYKLYKIMNWDQIYFEKQIDIDVEYKQSTKLPFKNLPKDLPFWYVYSHLVNTITPLPPNEKIAMIH